MRVLIVGGSGYLGQFLVEAMAADDAVQWVGYTFHSAPLTSDRGSADGCAREGYRVDLATGEGAEACIADATKGGATLDLVVNCAAMSSPAQCEKDEHRATAVNVPTALIAALTARYPHARDGGGGAAPLLVHLSTDQVYSGARAMSTVTGDPPAPVNAYGRSKAAAEEAVRRSWPNHVILRSSIITGPRAPLRPVDRPLMTDFIVRSLRGGAPVTFFGDEYRCPICVYDVVAHVRALSATRRRGARGGGGGGEERTFNMGGPDRVSRVDMARRAASVMGLDDVNVVDTPAALAAATRGVPSPADISMHSEALSAATGVSPRGWEEQVRVALGLPLATLTANEKNGG